MKFAAILLPALFAIFQFSSIQAADVIRGSEQSLAKRAFTCWAQFCDGDGNNCSISFDVKNPGCFSAGGDTIKIHCDRWYELPQLMSLVVSPSGNCPCQSDIYTFDRLGPGQTLRLNHGTGASYRWISGGGDHNNC